MTPTRVTRDSGKWKLNRTCDVMNCGSNTVHIVYDSKLGFIELCQHHWEHPTKKYRCVVQTHKPKLGMKKIKWEV